ncbi:hypothetical protein GGR56DRAFT_576232 [Xylariaceae sp. FL0804]|nr:hypothetical protein GGR56DRAFT_576232 [Xylariaceae sp. FL0804]
MYPTQYNNTNPFNYSVDEYDGVDHVSPPNSAHCQGMARNLSHGSWSSAQTSLSQDPSIFSHYGGTLSQGHANAMYSSYTQSGAVLPQNSNFGTWQQRPDGTYPYMSNSQGISYDNNAYQVAAMQSYMNDGIMRGSATQETQWPLEGDAPSSAPCIDTAYLQGVSYIDPQTKAAGKKQQHQQHQQHQHQQQKHQQRRQKAATKAPRGFPCTESGCAKSFKRKADRNRHVDRVHLGITSDSYCDRRNCSHGEKKFTRHDHIRDHYRTCHYEDLLRRQKGGGGSSSSGKGGGGGGGGGSRTTAAAAASAAPRPEPQSWWDQRDVDLRYWRCYHDLRRVYVAADGYVCPHCNRPCEDERRERRLLAAASRGQVGLLKRGEHRGSVDYSGAEQQQQQQHDEEDSSSSLASTSTSDQLAMATDEEDGYDTVEDPQTVENLQMYASSGVDYDWSRLAMTDAV